MKLKFLMTSLLGLATVTSFAQKGELSTAQSELGKYEGLLGNKVMAKLADASLSNAKTSIDKAAVNEKTAALPQTYAVKAAIYSYYVLSDTAVVKAMPYFTAAEAALKKATELDTKGENKKTIETATVNLANYSFNKGAREYNAKQYEMAFKSFDYYSQLRPGDTTAILYTGLSAANSNNFDGAIASYKKLLATDYKGKAGLYGDLTYYYIQKHDTTAAIKNLEEAAAKYPSDPSFSKRIIEMNLAMGKQAEVLAKIEGAIANDPKNKTLYYYGGATYAQVADAAGRKIKGTKDAAQIAAFTKTRDDNNKKAEDLYRRALEIDPNFPEVNLNLGFLLLSPAIDIYNLAVKIPVEKQKEYDAAMAKANAMAAAAKPFLIKAVELNPKSIDAHTNLLNYYITQRDTDKSNELKKKIADLQAAGAK